MADSFRGGIFVLVTDAVIGRVLEQFRCDDADLAWQGFLTSYSDLIFGVIGTFTRDVDQGTDCFLYVCEKLSEKKYRRLLAFHPDGRARFSTWLRVVVRNLCLDWLRSQFGRKQVFRSIASLDTLDQEIFRFVFQRGISIQNAWFDLNAKGFEVPYTEFEKRANRVRSLLTSRQLWLLSTSNTLLEPLDRGSDTPASIEIVDPSPDPEKVALLRDIHVAVSKAMRELDEGDRLLLRLRFLQGLGLRAIGELVGLKDAQTADRRIRDALQRLREKLGVPKPVVVKQNSVSV